MYGVLRYRLRTRLRAAGETLERRIHPPGLFLDARLVDEHHRNVVADRVDPLALAALQPVFVLLKLHRGLAQRGFAAN